VYRFWDKKSSKKPENKKLKVREKEEKSKVDRDSGLDVK